MSFFFHGQVKVEGLQNFGNTSFFLHGQVKVERILCNTFLYECFLGRNKPFF